MGDQSEAVAIFADLSALALFSQDSQGRIVRWNRGAERIFGYDETEIVGNALTSITPTRLQADLEVIEQRVARVDHVFTEIQRKDGMLVPNALSVAPVIDSSGAFIGAMGVAQELTESVVHPDDRDRARSLMEGAVASSQPFEDEYRLAEDGTSVCDARRTRRRVIG